MKSRLVAIATGGFLALLLGACGGDVDEAVLSEVPPGSPQPIATVQSFLSDEELMARLAEQVASFDYCAVSSPNGSQPPGEGRSNPNHHGNGELWTGLWPDGIVIFLPDGAGSVEPDGSLEMKFWWWRANPGDPISFEGRRLDGRAAALRAHVPDGYPSYFQATSLIFGSEGCWEVTGSTESGSLTFVTLVIDLR